MQSNTRKNIDRHENEHRSKFTTIKIPNTFNKHKKGLNDQTLQANQTIYTNRNLSSVHVYRIVEIATKTQKYLKQQKQNQKLVLETRLRHQIGVKRVHF